MPNGKESIPDNSCWRSLFLVQPLSVTTVVLHKCKKFCFPGSVLVHDLIFFQDSDMNSYVGFHCYKISSLFEDLANMNKTLSISVGLNSHAGNGQDTCTRNTYQKAHQHTKTHTGTLSIRPHGKLGQSSKRLLDISHQKGVYRPPQFGWKLLVCENSSAFPRIPRGRDFQSKAECHRTTSKKAQKLCIQRDCEWKAKATCGR